MRLKPNEQLTNTSHKLLYIMLSLEVFVPIGTHKSIKLVWLTLSILILPLCFVLSIIFSVALGL